jgi:signal peptidase I
MQKRTLKSGSCAVFFLLGVVAVYAVTRAILRRDADTPVRIAGGSMAPALLGEHFEVTCGDCSFRFAFGVESPPDGDLATCPNCGFQEDNVGGLRSVRGQRVRIEGAEWRADAPRRWDLVAIRRADHAAKLAVKRVVGLPGERVAIRGGEIYVDGRMLRKPLDVFRRIAVLVYDDDYRPEPTGKLPSRWAPEQPGDWVNVYHHWPGLPPPSRRVLASPVFDHYGYNQAASRSLNEVRDLMLQCRVSFQGPGILAVRCDDGTHRWEIHVSINTISDVTEANRLCHLTLRRDEQNVSASTTPAMDWTQPRRVEFALVDGQIFLAIGGTIVLTHVDEHRAKNPAVARQVTKPLAIGASGRAVEVSHLQVHRDLYYLHPWGNSADWEMHGELAEDEIFVLGDNCPASNDSRNWSPHGVRVRDVLGYVRPLNGE